MLWCTAGVSAVRTQWLREFAPSLCTLSKPLADPPPLYSRAKDAVLCWVSPSFGAKLWALPPAKVEMGAGKLKCAVFACALLRGKVVEELQGLEGCLAMNPGMLLRGEGLHHKRASDLVTQLYAGGVGVKAQSGQAGRAVDSLAALCREWAAQPLFLQREVLAWVRGEFQRQITESWLAMVLAVLKRQKKRTKT